MSRKGSLGVLAATGALALAGATAGSAATFNYDGHVKGGGDVSFSVKTRHHRVFIRDLTFTDVTARCEGAQGTVSVNLFGTIAVDGQLKFHATGEGGGGATHSRISGEFTGGGKRAHGKVRLYGLFGDGQGGTVRCNTGNVNWNAR